MGPVLGVEGIGEGHVGVVQHGEDVLGLDGHLLSGGQQGLPVGRQHMGPHADDFVQLATVKLKLWFSFIETLDRVGGEG